MRNAILILLCCFFLSSYSQERLAVVSVEKQNILYIGIDNPISIAIPGIPCSQTYATMSNGTLAGSGCMYTSRPKNPGESRISVYSISTSDTIIDSVSTSTTDTILVAKYNFRAKLIPDPVVFVSQKRNEAVTKGWLMAQKGPYAQLNGFDIEAIFKITSFRIKHYSSNKEMKDIYIKGTLFNADTQEMFNSSFKGDVFRIFDVKAIGADGIKRELEPMELYVEEKF